MSGYPNTEAGLKYALGQVLDVAQRLSRVNTAPAIKPNFLCAQIGDIAADLAQIASMLDAASLACKSERQANLKAVK